MTKYDFDWFYSILVRKRYSTGQGFFHQSARPRVQRDPMERIKILHPAAVTPESAGTRRPRCVIDR